MNGALRQDWIDVRAEDGSVRRVARAEFRASQLPALLAAHRAEPDRLAETILTALEAGLAAEVLAASEHLGRIDPDRRRRFWIPALVSSRAGKFRRAEEMLQRGRELFGDCADFACVEAEILLGRHLKSKGEAVLRAALDLDPNHSRALRLTISHHLLFSGEAARDRELERVMSRPGAWRPRLLVASSLWERGDAPAARALAVEVARMEPEEEILPRLSSVLAHYRELGALLEELYPRYAPERHGARCGVNLLFALLDARRYDEGLSLVASLREACPGQMDGYLRFYEAALSTRGDRVSEDSDSGSSLRRALASLARHDTPAHRKAAAKKLLSSALVEPLVDPVAIVPLLDLGIPGPAETPPEAVSAIDSSGHRVALAFTGDKPLAAWNAKHRHRLSVAASTLLERCGTAQLPALVIDAGGPASLELTAAQIESLLATGELIDDDGPTAFLVERLRNGLPADFLRGAAAFAREREELKELYFFEMIDERSGARPAAGIVFDAGTGARVRRDCIVEAGTRFVLRNGRKVTRVAVTEIATGDLHAWLASNGLRVRL